MAQNSFNQLLNALGIAVGAEVTPKPPAPKKEDTAQFDLNKLLAPFTQSLQGDIAQATPQGNPAIQSLMSGLPQQYQQALAPSMGQYQANMQSLPGLIQGATADAGKGAALGDLLNALRYEFIYGGQSPSSSIGQFSGLLGYLLGKPVSTAPTNTKIPSSLAPILDQTPQNQGGTQATTPSFG